MCHDKFRFCWADMPLYICSFFEKRHLTPDYKDILVELDWTNKCYKSFWTLKCLDFITLIVETEEVGACNSPDEKNCQFGPICLDWAWMGWEFHTTTPTISMIIILQWLENFSFWKKTHSTYRPTNMLTFKYLVIIRKYLLRGYILGVLTHKTWQVMKHWISFN